MRRYLRVKTRESARERFSAEYEKRCDVCGSTENIEIHHRNGDPFDNRILNLVPLCEFHHRQAHKIVKRIEHARDIDRWKEDFVRQLSD